MRRVEIPVLLAKSVEEQVPRGEQLLVGHSAYVARCADLLIAERGRHALEAARLPEALLRLLEDVVSLAAWLHDAGKCSRPFQEMLRGGARVQPVRHEAATLWLMWPGQPIGEWLLGHYSYEVVRLAAVAAAGHHRKFLSAAFAPPEAGAGSSCELLCGHADFHRLLATMAAKLELAQAPPFENLSIPLVGKRSFRTQLLDWKAEFDDWLDGDEAASRLLPLAKAFVLAADVAGSALPRADERPDWLVHELRRRAPRERMEDVVNRRLAGKALRPFQREAASSSAPVTLVRAGCGSGKTLAAYLWAAHQYPGRQLWVTYPTTGTATEGFRDYVLDADIAARLEHGRANVDMARLMDDSDPLREVDRLQALRTWGTEIVTCTVDTVLGLVQNQRRGIYAWPGLCHSAVIFDEIHAYDDRLFGSLLRFLEVLPGIPALLMTASLPAARLTRLSHLVEHIHGRALQFVEGPTELERLPRYRHVRANVDRAWDIVGQELARGGKILWVSNTVARAIAVFDGLSRRGHTGVGTLYHSRFRYSDRVDRHTDVIRRFSAPGPTLASTTQVAEMSLDLSATLLITDLAPIPALIQRLGRLNRRATPENPDDVRPFLVLPFSGAPYSREELEAASVWLDQLGDGPLAQSDLVARWIPQPAADVAPEPATWIDGGFNSEVAAVRDASPGLSVIREADEWLARAEPRRIPELLIPMGPHPSGEWKSWRRVAGAALVAPDSALAYDQLRGGEWRK